MLRLPSGDRAAWVQSTSRGSSRRDGAAASDELISASIVIERPIWAGVHFFDSGFDGHHRPAEPGERGGDDREARQPVGGCAPRRPLRSRLPSPRSHSLPSRFDRSVASTPLTKDRATADEVSGPPFEVRGFAVRTNQIDRRGWVTGSRVDTSTDHTPLAPGTTPLSSAQFLGHSRSLPRSTRKGSATPRRAAAVASPSR